MPGKYISFKTIKRILDGRKKDYNVASVRSKLNALYPEQSIQRNITPSNKKKRMGAVPKEIAREFIELERKKRGNGIPLTEICRKIFKEYDYSQMIQVKKALKKLFPENIFLKAGEKKGGKETHVQGIELNEIIEKVKEFLKVKRKENIKNKKINEKQIEIKFIPLTELTEQKIIELTEHAKKRNPNIPEEMYSILALVQYAEKTKQSISVELIVKLTRMNNPKIRKIITNLQSYGLIKRIN